mmetsp:Transcript_20482/g.52614  ORF Transcript_20482/g.52614 Transcript_20482/m.52614 type:complete len:268 (-) Transcript_20482:407-1210(-)
MRYAGQEVEEGAKRVFLCAEALVGRNVHHKRRPLWLLHGNSRWLLDAELLLAVFTREGIAVVYEQLSAERIHSAANGEVACVVVRGVVFVVVEKSVRGSCELLPSQQGGEGIPAPALVLVCLMPLQDFNGVVREEEVDNIVQFLSIHAAGIIPVAVKAKHLPVIGEELRKLVCVQPGRAEAEAGLHVPDQVVVLGLGGTHRALSSIVVAADGGVGVFRHVLSFGLGLSKLLVKHASEVITANNVKGATVHRDFVANTKVLRRIEVRT